MLFINLSCSGNNNTYELSQLQKIEKLVSIEPAPAAISFVPVFVTCSNGKIAETNFIILKHVYEISYSKKYTHYADFLFNVLNKKVVINVSDKQASDYFQKAFFIDSAINSVYKEKSIKGLIYNYCEKGSLRLNKQGLTENQLSTIAYFFFLNGYFRYDDDYNTTSDFKKMPQFN